MPDMSKPLAHLESLVETLRFQKLELRRKALEMSHRAESYEDAEWKAQKALDEERKLAEAGKSAEPK